MAKKSNLANKHGVLFNILATILWIWTASQILLIFWGLLTSLRGDWAYSMKPNRFFPEGHIWEWAWGNYAEAVTTMAYNKTSYLGMIGNSVWYSVGATFMKLLATTLLAYVMAQYEFFGKKALYTFLIIQIMLPIYGQTTANYVLLDGMGFVDTPLFLLALGAGHGMYFLIMHSYFVGISATYKEAAEIDGANDFTVFFRIMLPLGMSSVIAIGLMTFIGVWNDYQTAMLYLPSYPTLSAGLYKYQIVAKYEFSAPIFFSGIFMSALPTAVLFIVFNKTLMENITIGGIKG